MSLLALWQYLRSPSSKTGLFVILAFSFTLLTRSAFGIFAALVLAVIFFVCVIAGQVRVPQYQRTQCRALLGICIVCAAVFGSFVAFYWSDLKGYYFALLTSGEEAIRLADQGAINGLLMYYLERFWAHFSTSVYAGALAATAMAIGLAVKRSVANRPIGLLERQSLLVDFGVPLICICTVLAVLSMYSPNPAVIGVLLFPITIFFTNLFSLLSAVLRIRWLSILLATSILTAGLLKYAGLISSDPDRTAPEYEQARAFNRFYAILNDDLDSHMSKVAWMTLQEATFPLVFDLWRYEHGYFDRVPYHQSNAFSIFSVSASEIVSTISDADAVVIRTEFSDSTQFEHPFAASVRSAIAEWRPTLDEQFRRRWSGQDSLGEISYFLRLVRIVDYKNPNGVELRRTRGKLEQFMWLTSGPLL